MSQDLADYIGTYYSAELDCSYKVTLSEGKLYLKCKGNIPFELRSIGQDLFFAGDDCFKFIRDEQEQIIGLDRCGDRVRRLHFSKQ
ncbi:hypothetical protein [Chamaesiphon sp. GL140_3_metabinner_50]|uniref:hypothetical protein n=1 Tax=Chamaesiphon sp. GL140_3_metabinner_50 TaxID=2970812 RepID=UPI0025DA8999|nr:hypothetical protein [Chamaesiphon sp. GL140_3_metabinner_50]